METIENMSESTKFKKVLDENYITHSSIFVNLTFTKREKILICLDYSIILN